jgi:iron complex transport system ATP-binding protein
MLEAVDVWFAYGAAAPPVLTGVSLEVSRGQIVGLLGPNGSGKTTLLRIAAGLLHPTRGRVLMEGRPVEGFSRRELARRLAVVPQETQAAFDFTVLDIVLMGRYAHLGPLQLEGAADLEIAREALSATGTAALETRRFQTLSGGEKQRVVIASALAQASDLLLLDEPTASLDLGYQLEVAALLRQLNGTRRTTLLICTHDLNLAAALCHRVVLLRNGTVLAQGPTAETLTAPNILATYGVRAEVRFHEEAGHLAVIPIARTS